jgi:hypothetical protein
MSQSRFISLVAMLPHGGSLELPAWDRLHRGVLLLLGIHTAGISSFGLWMGHSLALSMAAGMVLLAFCIGALTSFLSRRAGLGGGAGGPAAPRSGRS